MNKITTQQKSKFKFYRYLFIAVFYLLTNKIWAQIDKEAIARLYFSLESEQKQWFDGYKSIISGSYSPYHSYRSGQNSDSAFVSRTTSSENKIEWLTDIIPQNWIGDSVSFVWICGFGNNLGEEWFDININDNAAKISFSTKNKSSWSINNKSGLSISFTAVYQNSNGAYFGYMILTISKHYLDKGKPQKINLSGRLIEKEIWYRLFTYDDVIDEIKKNSKKKIVSNLRLIDLGDAVLDIYASNKYDGAYVKLFASNKIIAKSNLKSDGKISKTSIFIPRNLQPVSQGLSIIKLAEKVVDTLYWLDVNRQRIIAFMNEPVEFESYVFPPGSFPNFKWKNELMIKNEIGDVRLNAVYFNKDFEQVSLAESPGRYGVIVTGETSSGFIVKRYITLYCAPVEFDDYNTNIPIRINKLKDYGIDDFKWEKYINSEKTFSFGSMKTYPKHDPDAAIFLAGLSNLDALKEDFDTPRIRDRQWWITLKRKLETQSFLLNVLKIPSPVTNDNTCQLIDTNLTVSYYNSEKINKIRYLCEKWKDTSGVPNVTLIIHKGKVVFFEAFGEKDDGKPLTKDTPIWMASITKLLTGVLIMQFVDQGIIDLDAPIGQYLPEVNGIANDKLTVRNLFNHTSGLQFAGEWASDWNVALENQIAQILPYIEINKTFSYHRVGYAIAGKIIERITGRAIPYLFQNYIFTPLGMKSAYSDNTYGGLYCNALDLAYLGQMLLNKGTYNGVKLFSARSFEKMLPKELSFSKQRWGIGTSPMDGNGLSNSAFGHGAASGTVFRIDPENDLIIISARNTPGKFYTEFEKALIENSVSLIKN